MRKKCCKGDIKRERNITTEVVSKTKILSTVIDKINKNKFRENTIIINNVQDANLRDDRYGHDFVKFKIVKLVFQNLS